MVKRLRRLRQALLNLLPRTGLLLTFEACFLQLVTEVAFQLLVWRFSEGEAEVGQCFELVGLHNLQRPISSPRTTIKDADKLLTLLFWLLLAESQQLYERLGEGLEVD